MVGWQADKTNRFLVLCNIVYRVVLCLFHYCLVSVLFIGSSFLLIKKFYGMFFSPIVSVAFSTEINKLNNE